MRIWLSNCDRAEAEKLRAATNWKDVLIGAPKSTDAYSVQELEQMEFVGIYRTSDREKVSMAGITEVA